MATTVRILADDLTGALDTAAEFAGMAAPMRAFWHGALPGGPVLPASAALDTGTRERGHAAAYAVVAGLAAGLAQGGIAFKKVDSLMRGPTLAEVAACFASGAWPVAVFAPAFPYQGRVTRGGRQYARAGDGAWVAAGPDLVDGLCAAGVVARRGRVGSPLLPGVSVFDAETDADLDAVVSEVRGGGRDAGPVLWCGTGGLARALAQQAGQAEAIAPALLPRPILGLFGSDQAATAAQLAACGPHWTPVAELGAAGAAQVGARLEAAGAALVSLELPPGLARDEAAARIAQALHGLCAGLPRPPGTLLVAGGETLRGLCLALGASSLELQGRICPGLPRSLLRGGRWDGVTVVSKSGAFGPPHLLQDLLHQNGIFVERMN